MDIKTEKMDFQVIDQASKSLLDELKRRIHRLQSGGTIDSLLEIGADTRKQIGASFVSLKELASHYEPNETVALLLWGSGRREEQIIASFLFPLSLNREKIMQLLEESMNMEVAGYLGSVYLFKHPQLLECVVENLPAGNPFQQAAILSAIAKHRIVYKQDSEISTDCFQEAINREYTDPYVRLVAERYRLNV